MKEMVSIVKNTFKLTLIVFLKNSPLSRNCSAKTIFLIIHYFDLISFKSFLFQFLYCVWGEFNCRVSSPEYLSCSQTGLEGNSGGPDREISQGQAELTGDGPRH